jgi:REP element-mobilizing transposase RayT
MFRLCPDLREELWGGELLGDGFYVATVGKGVSRNVILKYVAGQEKKERNEVGQLRLIKH